MRKDSKGDLPGKETLAPLRMGRVPSCWDPPDDKLGEYTEKVRSSRLKISFLWKLHLRGGGIVVTSAGQKQMAEQTLSAAPSRADG